MKHMQSYGKGERNAPCHCGSGRKYKKCHGQTRLGAIIKTAQQIEGIRTAGRINVEILNELETFIKPGVHARAINDLVHKMTLEHKASPAPLNYKGFPKSVCVSINEVVCHGIPDSQVLQAGDIVNVDVTTILDGYYSDSSRMYAVGEISPQAQRLIDVTKECLQLGIEQVRPQATVGDIGYAIQQYAEGQGFSVVRDFVGHGTGIDFHEEPQIPHFGNPGEGATLVPGMVFTIEPMINEGAWPVRILDDGWTAVTQDGSLSAQFEHTVCVTTKGYDILTA